MVHVPQQKLLNEVHLAELILVLVHLLLQRELSLVSVDPEHDLLRHNVLHHHDGHPPEDAKDGVPLHNMAPTLPRAQGHLQIIIMTMDNDDDDNNDDDDLWLILPPAPAHDVYPSAGAQGLSQLHFT